MVSYEGPISKFRDIVRNAGDDHFGFEIEGEIFDISMTYGETDLIPCPKRCKLNQGFYAVLISSEEFKEFIQIMYQCSYCDTVIIKNYNEETLKGWSKNESDFIRILIKYVFIKQLQDVRNYGKRQKFDILKDDLNQINEDLKNTKI